MIGGDDSETEDEWSKDSRNARLLMVAVLGLAVAATAALVLSDNAHWLRLGVLAALWAALLGVFLASRFRKSMTERENQVVDLRAVYEQELEREVAARREYELEAEAVARKQVEEANREDLAELRSELRNLRQSLERLTGGEVLVERFALQAQSTRMRSLSDGQQRVVASGEDSARVRRSLMAGQSVDPASTELIAPVRRDTQRRERPAGYRPEPSRPQTPRDGQDDGERVRREAPATAQPTRLARPVARQQTAQQPVQTQRTARVPVGQQPTPVAEEPPVQVRRPAPQQGWPGQNAAPAAQRPAAAQRPVARQNVRRQPTPGDMGLSARLNGQPEPPRQEPPRPEPQRAEPPRAEPPRAEPQRLEPQRAEPQRAEQPRQERHRPEPQRPEPQYVEAQYVAPVAEEPRRPEPQHREPPSGHHQPLEPTQYAEPVVNPSRHAAGAVTPVTPAAEPATGGHRRSAEAPKDWQAYREWRQEPESDPEITGAHAAGKSVTELLATHGTAEDSPRRHRRRAD
jgi:hypothetical protein